MRDGLEYCLSSCHLGKDWMTCKSSTYFVISCIDCADKMGHFDIRRLLDSFCQLPHTRYFIETHLVGSELMKLPYALLPFVGQTRTMKTTASLAINQVLPMVTQPSNPPNTRHVSIIGYTAYARYFIIKQGWKLINTFFEFMKKLSYNPGSILLFSKKNSKSIFTW